MTSNRHPAGITRPEFVGRVDTSIAGLSDLERLDLYAAKLSNRAPTGHRQITPERARSLSILGAAIGGGAFLAVVFAAVYFLEI